MADDRAATPSDVDDDDDEFLEKLAAEDAEYEKFVKDLWAPSALAKCKNSSS